MDATRRSRLTDTDRADWARFASRIRPLPSRPHMASTASVQPGLGERQAPQPPVRRAHAPSAAALAIGEPPGGVDRATWQRFRSGRLRAEKVLDLHGQTAQRAFLSLLGFLRAAYADRLRCVEVVTGRGSAGGEGVLRRELPLWLNLPDVRPLVLAAAHPKAANTGSVRLLLRRVR
jgi:DNA-nicking Smr family endonuclease